VRPAPGVSPVARWTLRLFWLVPLAFYGWTVCPGPGWIDSSMIAGFVHSLHLGTTANTHNLFHVLGRIWTLLRPSADPHAWLNLLCAALGAGTVYLVCLAGYRLTSNLTAALAGAVALMLSHSLWWHSTVLEVYTLNTLLLAGMVLCLVRHDRTRGLPELYAAAFLLGLACSNHVLMGLFAVAFVAVLPWPPARRDPAGTPRVLTVKSLCSLGLCFALGFGVFELAFLIDFSARCNQHSPLTYRAMGAELLDLVDGATGGSFRRSMFPAHVTAATRWGWRLNYLFTLLMNYPSVAFVLGGLGAVGLWRKRHDFPRTFVFVGVGGSIQAAWSANYMIWDMFAFGLPVWVLFGLLSIVGFDALWRRGRATRLALLGLLPSLLVGPLLYARIPHWAATPGFWQRYFAEMHHVANIWDPARYLANPNKRHYDAVSRFAQAVFRELPPGAHHYDSGSKGHYPLALYYQRVLRVRRDIRHHLIFGPALTPQSIAAMARDIDASLERGEAVYVSSPYWPERLVLNRLYAQHGPPRSNPQSLSVAQLERTFPRYELRRIPLIEGEPFFIYRLVPRAR